MAQQSEVSAQKTVPDWKSLTFSLTETDTMYRSYGDSTRDPVWDDGELIPFEDVRVSPAAAFMSYGLGVFEGLKANRVDDGRVLLFRPDANARRLQSSAERLMMAPFPADRFVDACVQVVRDNLRFVPPADHGSFYLRPIQHAVEARLGLGPCTRFSFLLFGSPVGSYFRGGRPQGVRLKVLEQGRCAPGGTGYAKAMGNYAGAIYVAAQWKNKGFDDVLYLDARHVKNLTETSGSNPFVRLRSGKLVTPSLDDQILPGVTRDSTVRLAREVLGLEVEERHIPIDEVLDDGVEMFCTGTAWTLQSVQEIVHKDRTLRFESEECRQELFEILRGIQLGQRADPFGWVLEV
ncbi:MAG: branched-chain amino acid aminotransferase [Planctomycetota bacterium]|nr:branched-chain amino acid aminotransferase [Planctomycetota bacterium]